MQITDRHCPRRQERTPAHLEGSFLAPKGKKISPDHSSLLLENAGKYVSRS
jgi:hypothetical protein